MHQLAHCRLLHSLVPSSVQRGLRGGLATFALVFATAAVAQRGSFTLEQVMGAPFPTDLVAAPAGGKVVWVLNVRGARNLWVAGPPEYRGRQVTAYTEDDGQDVGQLCWTPDGQSVVYTRGGDLEFLEREYPNPRSLPQGVEQGVWIVSSSGGEPRRLGEGHSAAVSPKGDLVAFVNKKQIWSAKLDSSEKAGQLVHARGDERSIEWSPDGSKLAFVSSRDDHSLIGVYDIVAKTLRYLDPSVDRDTSFVWSPDSRQIALVRIPSSRDASIFGPRRAAQPWSLRVADVSTGRGREAWKADEGRGSVFHGVVAERQLQWASGDRLVFPWEKDGWSHLYSVSVQGGPATLLTPGEFEVEHVSLSPDRREILFSSNQDDIDRRHLWRVSVAGGSRPLPVTTGPGIEWSPAPTSDGKGVAFLHSDARRAPRAAILLGSAEPRDLAPDTISSDFPERALVTPQQVIFSAADGLRIHSQLFLPSNIRPGERRPALIFFHGGSRREMLLGWHYMYYYRNAYAMNQYLVSRGYVVLSVNYRSGTGYGMDFREAANYGATGASEFNDVQGAGLYLRSRPDVDPQRIGVWGGSYGGYLTTLALARASDLFAAGVDFHGVHEWNTEVRNFASTYDPEANPDRARIAYESSPLASVKTWRSPVLLIHGDDDRNVNFNQTVRLVEALRKQGVPFEQLIFPDEIHDFLTYSRWVEAYHAAVDFFDRHLGPRR